MCKGVSWLQPLPYTLRKNTGLPHNYLAEIFDNASPTKIYFRLKFPATKIIEKNKKPLKIFKVIKNFPKLLIF